MSERISAEHQSRMKIVIINFKIQRVSEAFKFMRQWIASSRTIYICGREREEENIEVSLDKKRPSNCILSVNTTHDIHTWVMLQHHRNAQNTKREPNISPLQKWPKRSAWEEGAHIKDKCISLNFHENHWIVFFEA